MSQPLSKNECLNFPSAENCFLNYVTTNEASVELHARPRKSDEDDVKALNSQFSTRQSFKSMEISIRSSRSENKYGACDHQTRDSIMSELPILATIVTPDPATPWIDAPD